MKAAEQQSIRFWGFGGTSAGALVATLAAIGYTPDELKAILTDLKFNSFLDDGGLELATLRRLPDAFVSPYEFMKNLWRNYRVIAKTVSMLGLYGGEPMREFLLSKIHEKRPALKDLSDPSFDDLDNDGCVPLKIIATDLHSREPRIYSATGAGGENGSVLDAVRASACYPFIFRPVRINGRYLVDGGLCSNLPIFLFEPERQKRPLAVIAFDLIQRIPARGEYRFSHFCTDMLASALESGDLLLRSVVRNVHHVRVLVPVGIDTLDFDLDGSKTEALFNAGMAAAHSFFSGVVPQWAQAANEVELLQARVGVSNELVNPVLEAIALEFERRTRARVVRVSITLPTSHGTRIVTYQFGMDLDPDIDLELEVDAGCSGRAWMTKRPVAADLEAARGSFEEEWGMTREQQNKVRPDRQSMMSFPIFDLSGPTTGMSVDDLPVLGVLSVDSETGLADTGWVDDLRDQAVQIGACWADVVSRMLT